MTAQTKTEAQGAGLMDRLPLFVFLFITAIFFVTSHDLFRNQYAAFRGVEQFNPTEEEAMELLLLFEAGQTYKAVTYVLLGVVSLLGLLAFNGVRPLAVRGLYGRVAAFFFFWCLLSAAWSFEPDITARKLAIFVMLSLGALFVAARFRLEDLIYFILVSSVLYLVAGVLSEIFWGSFRPWQAGYRFSGTIHPNGQGMNCALLFLASLFAAARKPEHRRWFELLALLAFVCLVMTKSRTPLGVAFISLGLYALLWTHMSLKVFLATASGLVLCAIPIFYPVVGPLVEKVVLLGRTETTLSNAGQLTGRTDLWAACWEYIQERLLLGYGYNSFWTAANTEDIRYRVDWFSGSAHSVYLDLWLGLGIFGLAAYVILLIGALAYFGRRMMETGDTAHGFAFLLLLFSALHGLFESAFLFPSLYTFLVMMLMARRAFVDDEESEAAESPEPDKRGALAAAR